MAWAARFLDPRGRPAGLPDRPFSNSLPRCFRCSSTKFTATGNIFPQKSLGSDTSRAKKQRRRFAVSRCFFAVIEALIYKMATHLCHHDIVFALKGQAINSIQSNVAIKCALLTSARHRLSPC
jgi:hypothetical protein